MSAKDGKPNDGLGGPPDFTSSITETDYGLIEEVDVEKIVGAAELKSPGEKRALLRLHDGLLHADLAQALGLPPYAPARRLEEGTVPLVLGPLALSEIRRVAAAGLLSAQDGVLAPFGRWHSAKETFSELRTFRASDEVTETLTESYTQGAGTEDDDTDGENEPSALELDAVDDDGVGVAPRSMASESEAAESSPQEGGPALDLEDELKVEGPQPSSTAAATQAKPQSQTQPHAQIPVQAKTKPNPSSQLKTNVGNGKQNISKKSSERSAAASATPSSHSWLTTASIALLAGGGVYLLTSKREPAPAAPKSVPSVEVPVTAVATSANWPDSLKPRPLESLYEDDSPLVKKIRSILNAYQSGTTVLSPQDERVLRQVADPASGSFEARRLAANQLAVFLLASSRLEDARKVLKPILEASTSDPVTLLNATLLEMGNGDHAAAQETATAALRVVPPSMAWIAYSLVGSNESNRGRLDQADNYFRDALRTSSNNPFVYGLYIRAISEHSPERERVPQLIREALWADPDRLIDSPIRAPLAGHILTSFALEGLVRGAEAAEAKLSEGKKAYVRWLEARYRSNPLSQPLSRVSDLLAKEEDPQSQVLYAYTLKEQSRMDEASTVLARELPLLHGQEDMKSSWPWSFAGDVQFARGNVSQAVLYYQNALSRNPQDIAAVLGMAVALRESGEFTLAEQKLSEALALDPFFVPALLRISRFEWHRGGRAQ